MKTTKFATGQRQEFRNFKDSCSSRSSLRGNTAQISLLGKFCQKIVRNYKIMALVLILLLLFLLALDSFSLEGNVSYHNKSHVSFARRYLDYGIMFDAGSTGSRIHVFAFKKNSDGQLTLEDELFKEVKPGLSSYAKDPKKGAMTIHKLLQRGKDVIPPSKWHATPVALKATAGLRLLPKKASQQLLEEVYKVFKNSPFYVPEGSVTIMDGLDEGIFAWVTVNFLTGKFGLGEKSLVGALDLGGGSTQITFHPLLKNTIVSSPKDFTHKAKVFNLEYNLYSHSYLGLGLMSARAAITSQGQPTTDSNGNTISQSPCLSPTDTVSWVFGGKTISVSGHSNYSFDACLDNVRRIITAIHVDRQEEMNEQTFYTFSYFYDRAADLNLIDVSKGGVITVGDFIKRTKEVFTSSQVRPNKLASMDATYIVALLKYGYGLHDNRDLILHKKIDNVEVSWALGATLDMLSKGSGSQRRSLGSRILCFPSTLEKIHEYG